MTVNKNTNSRTLIGYQDLLFCGAGAMLLLFFIFAIRLGGNSILRYYNDADRGGANEDQISLPTLNVNAPEGKMQTIRSITFKGFSKNSFNAIKSDFKRRLGDWELSGYSDQEKESIIRQVTYNETERAISYLLILEKLKSRDLLFNINSSLPNYLLDARVEITLRIIEGKGLPFFRQNQRLVKEYDGLTICELPDSRYSEIRLKNINSVVFTFEDSQNEDCRFFTLR